MPFFLSLRAGCINTFGEKKVAGFHRMMRVSQIMCIWCENGVSLGMQAAAAAEAAEAAEKLAEAREAEVYRLLAANATLRDELAAAKARLVSLAADSWLQLTSHEGEARPRRL